MSSKPKILIITDTAAIDSGMGVAHREIASRLHKTGKYEISSFGWFFHCINDKEGWKYPWKQFTTNTYDRPYGHPEGYPNCTSAQWEDCTAYQIIEQIHPDIVLAIGDMWMCDYLYDLPNRKQFKLIHEIPIDGEPIPKSWVRKLKTADIPIVMSKYGRDVIQRCDSYTNVEVLPRGLDLRYFQKFQCPKDELREKVMKGSMGKFVVGVFDRFQDRKQIQRAVEAFSTFVSDGKHEDCDLYLHLDMNDPFSLNAHKNLVGEDGIIERYGITDKVVFNQNVTVEKGVDLKTLVALYNCCDVKMSSTQGEGWGLTNVEAMACGTSVIATNYTTLPELIGEGRGLLADVKTFVTGMYNVERALVDTDHLAQLLEMTYRSPALRYQMSVKSQEFVKQFDWPIVIKQWERLLDNCMQETPYRLGTEQKKFFVDTKEVNIHGALRENTGWAITTRGFAQALESNKWSVSITESGGSTDDYELGKRLEQLSINEKSRNIDLINHMPQYAFEIAEKSNAKFKALYFPWELDRMHYTMVQAINRLSDIYLCPSKFCQEIAIRSGVRNTSVVPLASDLQPSERHLKCDKKYKFLMVGNLGDLRKNCFFLIKAFMNTFTDQDDVALILKSMPGHDNSDPNQFIDFEKLAHNNAPEIQVYHVDDPDLTQYYNSCDCLIQPSLCEGWGHPVFEALSMGMPVIATDYGGYKDFAEGKPNVQLIPGEMEVAVASPLFTTKEHWCKINYDGLCGAMRKAYTLNMKKSTTNLVPEYTWQNTGKHLIESFDKIVKKEKVRIDYNAPQVNQWNNDNSEGFKTYAPPIVDFVNSGKSDLQILDFTRISDKNYLTGSKYVIFMHCFGEWSEENPVLYQDIFANAEMVYSHLNLAKMYPDIEEKFMRGPWGCFEDKWFKVEVKDKERFHILNTGQICETEGIKESIVACDRINASMLHVGLAQNFQNKSYNNANNLSVEELRTAYNESKWVSALRRVEGFEKPAIEGLLCGCRPICFDTPLYRYWYDGIAKFVKEGTESETCKDMVRVFKEEYEPVTEEEMSNAVEKFGWRNVSINFWNELERRGII